MKACGQAEGALWAGGLGWALPPPWSHSSGHDLTWLRTRAPGALHTWPLWPAADALGNKPGDPRRGLEGVAKHCANANPDGVSGGSGHWGLSDTCPGWQLTAGGQEMLPTTSKETPTCCVPGDPRAVPPSSASLCLPGPTPTRLPWTPSTPSKTGTSSWRPDPRAECHSVKEPTRPASGIDPLGLPKHPAQPACLPSHGPAVPGDCAAQGQL